MGKSVLSRKISTAHTNIKLQNITEGVYYLKIGKAKQKTFKILKKQFRGPKLVFIKILTKKK